MCWPTRLVCSELSDQWEATAVSQRHPRASVLTLSTLRTHPPSSSIPKMLALPTRVSYIGRYFWLENVSTVLVRIPEQQKQ